MQSMRSTEGYWKHRLRMILAILGTSILFDQITKIISEKFIPSRAPIVLLWGSIRLQHVENAGAMLGLGSGFSENTRFIVFVVLVSIALLALFLYTLWNRRLRTEYVVAVSLILGGGLSNLFDRLMNDGVVRDFMNVGIGRLRTGIFNVADMLILSGLAVLLFAEFRRRKRPGDELHHDSSENLILEPAHDSPEESFTESPDAESPSLQTGPESSSRKRDTGLQ